MSPSNRNGGNSDNDLQDLRSAARTRLQQKLENDDAYQLKKSKPKEQLVHELQVHQVELEMQNEQLRESQVQLELARDAYKRLFDMAPVGYLTLSSKGIVEDVNLQASTILGMERIYFDKTPFSIFVDRNDQDAYYLFLRGMAKEEFIQTCVIWILSRTGDRYRVELEGIRDKRENGEFVFHVAMTDVTQRQKAELERDRMKAVIDTSPDYIGLFDMDGHCIYLNPAVRRLLGLEQDDYLEQCTVPFGQPDWASRLVMEEGVPTAKRKGQWMGETAFLGPDGDEVPVSELIVVHRDRRGERSFISSVCRDIFEYKQIQSELKSLNERLEERVQQRTTNLRETNLALQQEIQDRETAEKELRDLSQHMERMREDERKRIAREIHDQLGQDLTALDMDLNWLRKRFRDIPCEKGDVVRDKLEAMLHLVRDASHTVRTITMNLRPSILDDLGLPATLEWLGQDFIDRTGIVCQVDAAPSLASLDGQVAEQLFRMAQEGLTNVMRHAEATHVRLSLVHHSGSVELEVEDNGKGMDDKQPMNRSSYGLLGLQERVAGLDGKVDISSSPGKGTTLRIAIPMTSSDVG